MVPSWTFVGHQIIAILFTLNSKIILNNMLIFNAELLISFVDGCNKHSGKQDLVNQLVRKSLKHYFILEKNAEDNIRYIG